MVELDLRLNLCLYAIREVEGGYDGGCDDKAAARDAFEILGLEIRYCE